MKALLVSNNNPPLTAFLSRNATSARGSMASLTLAPLSSPRIRSPNRTRNRQNYQPRSQSNDEEDTNSIVEDLRVPQHWSQSSKAVEESEWLRVRLHKWLDDEYCPEPTNVDISRVAAQSYHQSLTEKQNDLGEILLKMALDLESISYQESFHGAFSSANAAINLIAERIDHLELDNPS